VLRRPEHSKIEVVEPKEEEEEEEEESKLPFKGAYFMCIFEVSFIHLKFMSSLRSRNIDINELGNSLKFVILLLK
jgi:hypothetical protein